MSVSVSLGLAGTKERARSFNGRSHSGSIINRGYAEKIIMRRSSVPSCAKRELAAQPSPQSRIVLEGCFLWKTMTSLAKQSDKVDLGRQFLSETPTIA